LGGDSKRLVGGEGEETSKVETYETKGSHKGGRGKFVT